jgi:drug/metabolite transporter (DMT)-like permease
MLSWWETLKVHTVLFTVLGVGIGVGTVVAKIGLSGTNPVVFAFIRNAAAAPLLLVPAYFWEGARLEMKHAHFMFGCGALLFTTNFFYTIGLKLSSAVIGSAWQCTIPIFTSIYAIFLGREKSTVLKVIGFLAAVGGALVILLFKSGGSSNDSAGGNFLAANVCFFLNVNAFALYSICMKPMMKIYPALSLTSWSFIICASLMLPAVLLTSYVKPMHDLVCGDCKGSDWTIPSSAVFALLWMVLIFSIAQYATINWASGLIDSSKITIYCVWQPFLAVVCTFILIATGYPERHPDVDLNAPGLNTLGVIGIIAGESCRDGRVAIDYK